MLALVGGVQFSGGSVKPQNKRLAKRTIDEVSTLNSLKVKKGE
jgi:hypothetical protein